MRVSSSQRDSLPLHVFLLKIETQHSVLWFAAMVLLVLCAPRFTYAVRSLVPPGLLLSAAPSATAPAVWALPSFGVALRGVAYLALSECFLFGFLFHYNIAYFLTVHRSAPPPAVKTAANAAARCIAPSRPSGPTQPSGSSGDSFDEVIGDDAGFAIAREVEEGDALDSWRSKCQPTMSTYGQFASWTSGNLNLHVEHHDFPSMPWTRLPRLRATAPEYYDCLASMDGWFDTIARYFQPEGDTWVYACTG